MSSSFYEESGKSLSLDLKTISYQGIVYIMDHELIDRRPLLSENMWMAMKLVLRPLWFTSKKKHIRVTIEFEVPKMA